MSKKLQTLNIGTSNVELAEYESGGRGQLTLVRYGVTRLDAPLDFETAETILAPALLGLVRETGIRPGPVSVSIPGQCVFTKFAAVPNAGGSEKFEQMIRMEIEQGIPFPIDEMICDRQVLGETENGDTSVMIVAAKTDQVESLTKAIASVGFQPQVVDSSQGALTNAIRYLDPATAEACVITLWMGSKATSLVITEGDKVYTRLIPIGESALVKEIAGACGCTMEEAEQLKNEKGYVALGGVVEDEDEVADCVSKACRAAVTRLNAEISRSVNFYRSQQQGGAPAKVFLTGSMALLPQIDSFFAEALGVEVEFLNPFATLNLGPAVDASALETDVAYLPATVGLAVQAIGQSVYNVNLLPPSLVTERTEKARVPFVAVGGIGIAAALVLVALAIGNGTSAVEAARDGIQSKVSSLERFDREIAKAQTALDAAKAEADALRVVLDSRLAALRRLNAVRGALLPGMWIHAWSEGRVTVRYWKDRLANEGGKTASEAFAEKLRSKPGVEPASVRISDMSAAGGLCEQFTVEVKFK